MSRSQPEPNSHAHGEAQTGAGVVRGFSGRMPSLTPARTLLGAFSRTCRFDAALATVTPVLATTTAAWWLTGRVDMPIAA
ncbi:MAG: hypothetical protein ACRC1H_05900, partial [Caldilineaceae bacterium]